jgi:hypothetical protein
MQSLSACFVFDLEQEIQERITSIEKYLNPLNNPAFVRSYQIEIDTLKSAPRRELEIAGMLRRLNAKANQTVDIAECEPLFAKREALEWLLQLIRYSKSLSPEWSKS